MAPAEAAGVTVDDDLVKMLLDDVSSASEFTGRGVRCAAAVRTHCGPPWLGRTGGG